MAGNDIGVTFIPSEQNQLAQGPRQGASEGDLSGARPSDLGTAFKILNLKLPSVVSAAAPASSTLLKSPGVSALPGTPPAPAVATGMPGMRAPNASLDPMAAVFAALLRAMQFGGAAPVGGGGTPDAVANVGAPKVVFQQGPPPGDYAPSNSPTPSVPSAAASDPGSAALPQQEFQSWAGSY